MTKRIIKLLATIKKNFKLTSTVVVVLKKKNNTDFIKSFAVFLVNDQITIFATTM